MQWPRLILQMKTELLILSLGGTTGVTNLFKIGFRTKSVEMYQKSRKSVKMF